jgi:hypothetical protein
MPERERFADVRVAARRGKASLRRAVSSPPEDAPDRQAELAGKIVRLIESALKGPERMQRHWNHGVGAGQHVWPGFAHQPAQRLRKHAAPVVLEGMHDRAKRSVIETGAARDVEGPAVPAATHAEGPGDPP